MRAGRQVRKLQLLADNIDVRQTVAGRVPRIPFRDIARDILPQRYVLSLVVCGDKLARSINRKYRKMNYPPNVLSFPLGEYEGEIFLNARKAEREARTAGIGARHRMAHLFVHGCMHLKGYEHGRKMDLLEGDVLGKFGFGAYAKSKSKKQKSK